jgi:TRIAP1/MDM35 family protein
MNLFRKQCLTVSQRALKERGIDSMLDEARESNRENDAEHMKGT